MASEGVLLPWIHEHPMMPWYDLRKGDCCGRFDSISAGYYCKSCDFFVHEKCADKPSKSIIQHQSHPSHPLLLKTSPGGKFNRCDVCGRRIMNHFYRCTDCDFSIDLYCNRYTPPYVIQIPEMHHHELTLSKKWIEFDCAAKCGKPGRDQFPYKCYECDISFHIDCVWYPPDITYPPEVNHSYHSLHPLKLVIRGQLPDYSDGKCRLCGGEIDRFFYHCSSCNFTLDLRCVLHPPVQSLLNLKAHGHQLTLLPRLISFTCNVCGLNGDRSPYTCVQCDFVIHQDCISLPRLININRHDHRVSRIPLIGVVNSVCRVCRKKVDWTCGGYSCESCPGYVVHSKCATRRDVWNGKELEGVPEEKEDIKPYVVIDDNTIQHFSHTEHHLRLNVNGFLWDDSKRCRACTHSICLQPFYSCMNCDFILHQNCAELPKRKWHMLHYERLTLVTSQGDHFWCRVCRRISNGFRYQQGDMEIDVRCSSICEPFVHPSHSHPLYHTPPTIQEQNCKKDICSGCNQWWKFHRLKCIEYGCRFVLCFKCATVPQVVKHRVDDHPLSLCYGEKANGKFWCDICEKETNPKEWFYTCKDHKASLHIDCVLGKKSGVISGLMPRSTIKLHNKSFEVVVNNSLTRPICRGCQSRCIYPIILKMLGTSDTYLCSYECQYVKPRYSF